MRPRLFVLLALVALLVGAVAHEAFAGHDAKPQTAKQVLTPAQRAARKKLLATAAYMKQHNLSCGSRHHFPAPKG
jgi:Na+-transporting methylmalonyl-CoA/oxaloacetate decarboxylase gamma subunit